VTQKILKRECGEFEWFRKKAGMVISLGGLRG
jgi:hypothetical protein